MPSPGAIHCKRCNNVIGERFQDGMILTAIGGRAVFARELIIVCEQILRKTPAQSAVSKQTHSGST